MDGGRVVLGFVESVVIKGRDGGGNHKKLKVKARIDTGATMSAIDKALLEELEFGPVVKRAKFRSTVGKEKRKIIKVSISLKGKNMRAFFSVSDRSQMKYRMLIGQNILKLGKFLIDPSK